jgi:hypothetical protein
MKLTRPQIYILVEARSIGGNMTIAGADIVPSKKLQTLGLGKVEKEGRYSRFTITQPGQEWLSNQEKEAE